MGRKGEFHRVSDDQAGGAILALLRGWLPGQSWSQVRGLLQGRRVLVSGNLCLDEGRRLKAGEVVKVLPHPLAAPPRHEDVRVRYIDAHLVIVEKPAGMTTLRHAEERHWPRRRKQLQPTLDEVLPEVLAARGAKQPGGGRAAGVSRRGRPLRPRAVHRLDRETSGLMVFALSVDAEQALTRMFREHALDRAYWAVALGAPAEQTRETWLLRDRGDGLRGSAASAGEGKARGAQRAVTHVRPLERLGPYTLVECRLETGRTHQIRVHLAEIGCPVCGDKMYRGPLGGPAAADQSHAPRVALHAVELGFAHPITHKQLRFRQEPPADFEEFVRRLRQARDGGG